MIQAFPVPGRHIKLDITASTSAVPRGELLAAVETGLLTAVHRIMVLGPNAYMTPAIVRYGGFGITLEVATREIGSMTWVDMTATLWGILDFTARNGYSGRAFRIDTDTGDCIGNGRFYSGIGLSPPPPLPAGSNRSSQTS